jgi:hypothetical protein
VRLIGQEAGPRYLAALFVGLLVYVVLYALVLPLVAGTVIGLPFLLLAWMAAKWLGIAGIFFAFGSRVGRGLGREMSPMGAVLLVFAAYALILLLLSPFGLVGLLGVTLVRMVFFCLVEAPALGLILLTRIGTRRTNGAVPAARVPPAAEPIIDDAPPGVPSADRSD